MMTLSSSVNLSSQEADNIAGAGADCQSQVAKSAMQASDMKESRSFFPS